MRENPPSLHEKHPRNPAARLIRTLRGLRSLPGWERLATLMVPMHADGDFTVRNADGVFSGNLSSFIERRVYLFGGYEQELIAAFLGALPDGRRSVILDVGANVGTHSLAFSKVFETVHSFEPNPELWENFERNRSTSRRDNVVLHKSGLGDTPSVLPLYRTARNNMGLGTVLPAEQYDVPLEKVAEVAVECGDDVVVCDQIARVDAIKIDVQGYESQVITGLRKTLMRDRPCVWFELGHGTSTVVRDVQAVRDLFPWPIELARFRTERAGPTKRTRLLPVERGVLPPADYLVKPARNPG